MKDWKILSMQPSRQCARGGEGLKTPKDTFSTLDVMLFCSFSEVGRPKTNKKSSFPQIDIYLDKHVLFDLNGDTKAEV